jgi:RecA-family ATPase
MKLSYTPLTIGRAAHTAWDRPHYILGPLQAGDIGLLSGADGSGKSIAALAAAASVAYGKSLLGGI